MPDLPRDLLGTGALAAVRETGRLRPAVLGWAARHSAASAQRKNACSSRRFGARIERIGGGPVLLLASVPEKRCVLVVLARWLRP
jgi:hypothetical protein